MTIALRRWRRELMRGSTRIEWRQARAALRARPYDVVLDLQGLVKSALVARCAAGERIGFAPASAREPLACRFYDRTYAVDMKLHAIERLRSLAGQAFGYAVMTSPRFDLVATAPLTPALTATLGTRYAVFLHASSRAEKAWPAEHWVRLGERCAEQGTSVVLPWGSAAEHDQASGLAAQIPRAQVAPRLTLGALASVLARATYVVGVDTGLTHLAAALDVPTVALFAATPAWRYGPYWTPRACSLGANGQWPEAAEVVAAIDQVSAGR